MWGSIQKQLQSLSRRFSGPKTGSFPVCPDGSQPAKVQFPNKLSGAMETAPASREGPKPNLVRKNRAEQDVRRYSNIPRQTRSRGDFPGIWSSRVWTSNIRRKLWDNTAAATTCRRRGLVHHAGLALAPHGPHAIADRPWKFHVRGISLYVHRNESGNPDSECGFPDCPLNRH